MYRKYPYYSSTERYANYLERRLIIWMPEIDIQDYGDRIEINIWWIKDPQKQDMYSTYRIEQCIWETRDLRGDLHLTFSKKRKAFIEWNGDVYSNNSKIQKIEYTPKKGLVLSNL